MHEFHHSLKSNQTLLIYFMRVLNMKPPAHIVEGSAEKGEGDALSVDSATAKSLKLHTLLLSPHIDASISEESELLKTVEHILDMCADTTPSALVQKRTVNFRAASDCIRKRLLMIGAEERESSVADDMAAAGKLGPQIVRIHSSGDLDVNPSGLFASRTVGTNFSSARANACVIRGKRVYEVTLLTAGVQQLGWATLSCPFTNEEGVGDSPDSYACDGERVQKWNGSSQPYSQPWVVGEVFGSCLDMEGQTIAFHRNGVSLGTAFTGVSTPCPGCAYFPALSLSNGERCELNFGSRPFQYPVPPFLPLQAPPTLNPTAPHPSEVIPFSGSGVAKQASYLLACLGRLL